MVVQAHVDAGSIEEGLALAQMSLEHCVDSKDLRGQIFALDAIVRVSSATANWDQAVVALQRGLKLCRELGDQRWIAHFLLTLSGVHSHARQWGDAMEAARSARAMCQEAGDKSEEAASCKALADVFFAQGSFASAIESLEEQCDLYRETGEQNKEGFARLSIARIRAASPEHFHTALTAARSVLEFFRELDDGTGQSNALLLIAEIHLLQEDILGGLDASQEMTEMLKGTGDVSMLARSLEMKAKLHLAENISVESLGLSVKAAAEALALSRRSGDKRFEFEMLLSLIHI